MMISKRIVLNGVAALALAASLAMPQMASAATTLRVFAWDGYADKDWVAEFEKANSATVQVVIVSSDEELWAKIQGSGGEDADLIAVNTGGAQRYIDAGLFQPMDLSKIPNHEQQQVPFRDLSQVPGTLRDGKAYLMPYAFGPDTVVYDPKKVQPAPTSWNALWDPKYKGKVLTYDNGETNFTITALAMGIENPFKLTDDQLEAAKKKLVDLKHSLAGYYNFSQDAVQLAQNNDIAIFEGAYGQLLINQFKAAGIPVVSIVPKEGSPAWLDTWAITKPTKGENLDLAYKWINFMIGKEKSQQLTDRTGFGNTMTASDAVKPGDKILWVQPVEDEAKRTELWNQVKATP